tara:strand:+ start:6396 stop:6752 length:357 start_codon:yes stop_codon:yes gene_type:complete
MPWQPKRAGPSSIRELYHWAWGQLNELGKVAGGNTPTNLHSSLTDVVPDQHHPQLHDLTSHTDVSISTATDGEVLTYESSTSLWKNSASSGGGGSRNPDGGFANSVYLPIQNINGGGA